MNTEQLKTFLSLVETKNFSRSAENMFVAQSTISKRINELEKEMNQILFIRKRTGVLLTSAGKTFLEYAEQIINMEEKAKLQVHQKSLYKTSLTVGTVYAYYDAHLTESLTSFVNTHPQIAIQVKFGHTYQVLSSLKKAIFDIAYTHHPYHHPEYICRQIGQDDVILVTNPKNRKFINGISHRQIRELPLISSNFLYTTTHHWLFPRSYQFALEIDIGIHTVSLLQNSQWYTMIARKIVKDDLNKGTLIEIPVKGTKVPPVFYYIIYRKVSEHQMALKYWLKYHEKHFSEMA